MNKIGYVIYVKDCLSGFDGSGLGIVIVDLKDVLEFVVYVLKGFDVVMFVCIGLISYRGESVVNEDIENFKVVIQQVFIFDVFISVVLFGVIFIFLENQFYFSEDVYVEVFVEGMCFEFEVIYQVGFLFQIDLFDFVMG